MKLLGVSTGLEVSNKTTTSALARFLKLVTKNGQSYTNMGGIVFKGVNNTFRKQPLTVN